MCRVNPNNGTDKAYCLAQETSRLCNTKPPGLENTRQPVSTLESSFVEDSAADCLLLRLVK